MVTPAKTFSTAEVLNIHDAIRPRCSFGGEKDEVCAAVVLISVNSLIKCGRRGSPVLLSFDLKDGKDSLSSWRARCDDAQISGEHAGRTLEWYWSDQPIRTATNYCFNNRLVFWFFFFISRLRPWNYLKYRNFTNTLLISQLLIHELKNKQAKIIQTNF